jgi:hypothetical protein
MTGFWLAVLAIVILLIVYGFYESEMIEESSEPASPTRDAYDV